MPIQVFLASLGVFALFTSCTTVPPGVVSVEARGALHSTELWAGLANGLFDSGAYSTPPRETYEGGSSYHSATWGDDFHASYGLRATVNTPKVDLVGGVDRHWFDDRGADEVSLGVRRRFGGDADPNPGYLLALVRHGAGLRTDKGHEDYDGVALGIGSITALGEHWFLDVSLEAEWTWNQLQIQGDGTYLFSMMLNVGIGFWP